LKSGLNCFRAGNEDDSTERILGIVLTFKTQFSKKYTAVTWKDVGSMEERYVGRERG
jgi:hypothetical protein